MPQPSYNWNIQWSPAILHPVISPPLHIATKLSSRFFPHVNSSGVMPLSQSPSATGFEEQFNYIM